MAVFVLGSSEEIAATGIGITARRMVDGIEITTNEMVVEKENTGIGNGKQLASSPLTPRPFSEDCPSITT